MKQLKLEAGENSIILVESVAGDLRVAGWERAEIMAKTNGENLNIEEDGENIAISCDDDLIIYMPRLASLIVENVAGEVSLQALKGQVKFEKINSDLSLNDVEMVDLETISGDVSLRNVGNITMENVHGDLNLQKGRGDCSVETIHGDVSIRDVEGNIHLEQVNGDLYVRNVRGSVNADVNGDAALNLSPVADETYRVNAEGDLLLHLPEDANAELHLAAMDGESLHVDFPGVTLEEESPTQKIKLGDGSAKIYLTASGDLIVTSKTDRWNSTADFGVGMSDGFGIPPIPPIPPFPHLSRDLDGLSNRINVKVQKALEKVQMRTDGLSRRAEERVEAAMRRAEAKGRAAEVRARRGHARQVTGRINVGATEVFNFSSGKKQVQPVSDEERMTILRMLQEKKISVADAEKLLSALEGQGE
jgi:hypothetical protein